MTDPNKYAFRMLFLLVIVIILIGLLFNPLKEAFEGNSALNGATHLLLSNQARNKLVKYVKQINHLELETKTEFFDYFVEGCQFKKMNL